MASSSWGSSIWLGLTKDEFRKAVWKERYYELTFENKIWFDMARTRKVLNLTTRKFDDYVRLKFVYGTDLTERELLFSIPTSEIKNNKKTSFKIADIKLILESCLGM